MTHRSTTSSVALGWVVGVVLYGVFYAVSPWQESGRPYPYWALATSQIGTAVVAVLPGVTAGYFAGRSGFWVGAVAGVLVSTTVPLVSAVISWPSVMIASHVTATFVVNSLSAIVAAFITNGLSGIAGAHIHSLPSNRPVEADARKSDARGSP